MRPPNKIQNEVEDFTIPRGMTRTIGEKKKQKRKKQAGSENDTLRIGFFGQRRTRVL